MSARREYFQTIVEVRLVNEGEFTTRRVLFLLETDEPHTGADAGREAEQWWRKNKEWAERVEAVRILDGQLCTPAVYMPSAIENAESASGGDTA